jgi:hypothetical protein
MGKLLKKDSFFKVFFISTEFFCKLVVFALFYFSFHVRLYAFDFNKLARMILSIFNVPNILPSWGLEVPHEIQSP